MPDLIGTSFYFKFARNWIAKLSTELTKIRSKRKENIDLVFDVFGDSRELAKYYIEPHCQQFNPSDDLEDDVVREPVFSRIERFFSKEKKFGKQLFVLSDAGMGKTSLLLMLYLSHLRSFWPKGFQCVLLKLGRDTEERIKKISGRADTVLLLDALDEDPLAWGRTTQRISDILKSTQTFRRVVITCRTQFFSAGREPFNRKGQVEVGGFLCPVIFISLFDDIQVASYLKKKFPGENDKIEKAESLLFKMGSLRMRPMLLDNIEYFLDSDTTAWDEFSIYEALVEEWLLREQRKALEWKDRPIPTKDQLWSACRCIASELHSNTQLTVTEIKMKQILKENPDVMHLDSIDVGGRSLLNKNSDGDFRFSHYSIQEFLIAHGVVYSLFKQRAQPFRSTDQIVKFLRSWLTRSEFKEKSCAKLSLLDLTAANLSSLDLSKMDLHGGSFKQANMQHTKLASSNASECIFRGTKFDDANLSGANLEYSDFTRSSLIHTQLEGVKMRNSTAANADFQGSNITNSVLYEMNFCRTNMQNADFENSNLSKSVFRSATLKGTKFTNATLSNVDFGDATLDQVTFGWAKASGASFTGAIVKGADLSGVDLRNVKITGATFQGMKMESSNLDKCDLQGVNFYQTVLKRTSFDGADLRKAVLEDSSLVNAKLRQAKMDDANMKNVDLRGAVLSGTRIARVRFERAILDGLDFRGFNFISCSFSGSSLKDVRLDGCFLEDADFELANLQGANLSKTLVANAVFEGADLRGAILSGMNLEDALLKSAVLNEQNLSEFDLSGCDLRRCHLQDVFLEGSNLKGSDLREADLTAADLSLSDLRNAIMTKSILRGANLRGADLRGADLRAADLTEAKLNGTRLNNITSNALTIWPSGFRK